MARIAMVIDLDRCVGCHSCTVACKQENNVDLGAFLLRVHQVGPIGKYPDHLEMYYLPVGCQHCGNPPCLDSCSAGALSQQEDGGIVVDQERCTGCKQCMTACPYGAYAYNSERRIVQKCDLCVHLIDRGEKAPCASVCATQAISIGDIDDPNSDVSRKVSGAGKRGHILRPKLNTRPSVYYILRKQTWRGFPGRRETSS